MGSTTDKIKGAANKVVGGAKRALGEASGDRELKGEGRLQETKGGVQQGVGKLKSAAKKAVGSA